MHMDISQQPFFAEIYGELDDTTSNEHRVVTLTVGQLFSVATLFGESYGVAMVLVAGFPMAAKKNGWELVIKTSQCFYSCLLSSPWYVLPPGSHEFATSLPLALSPCSLEVKCQGCTHQGQDAGSWGSKCRCSCAVWARPFTKVGKWVDVSFWKNWTSPSSTWLKLFPNSRAFTNPCLRPSLVRGLVKCLTWWESMAQFLWCLS